MDAYERVRAGILAAALMISAAAVVPKPAGISSSASTTAFVRFLQELHCCLSCDLSSPLVPFGIFPSSAKLIYMVKKKQENCVKFRQKPLAGYNWSNP